MGFARLRPLAAAVALAGAALAAACGDEKPPASTVTVRETVTRTVTAPSPATTPAAPAKLTLREAEQVLDARGFATLTARDWHPDQALKVLLGVRRDAGGDEGAQQAFFFVGDEFIGTDASEPSGRIEVAEQRDDAITLTYRLYAPGDGIDAPSAGTADVTFAWDGARLVPRQPIPPADPDASPSRR